MSGACCERCRQAIEVADCLVALRRAEDAYRRARTRYSEPCHQRTRATRLIAKRSIRLRLALEGYRATISVVPDEERS